MSTCVGIQEDEQRTEEGTDRTAQNQIWYRCRINEVTPPTDPPTTTTTTS